MIARGVSRDALRCLCSHAIDELNAREARLATPRIDSFVRARWCPCRSVPWPQSALGLGGQGVIPGVLSPPDPANVAIVIGSLCGALRMPRAHTHRAGVAQLVEQRIRNQQGAFESFRRLQKTWEQLQTLSATAGRRSQDPGRSPEGVCMTIDERRSRVRGWLKVVKTAVQNMHLDDKMFWTVQNIINDDPRQHDRSAGFQRHYANCYAPAAAAGIRRLVKPRTPRSDCISLLGILEEFKKYPDLLGREHYLGFFHDADQSLVNMNGTGYFDKVAGAGADAVPSAVIDGHIAEMEAACEHVEAFADKRVAHWDRKAPKDKAPSFKDVTEAITALDLITRFYHLLLEGSAPDTLGVSVDETWLDTFAIAWLPNDATDPVSGVRTVRRGDRSVVEFRGR